MDKKIKSLRKIFNLDIRNTVALLLLKIGTEVSPRVPKNFFRFTSKFSLKLEILLKLFQALLTPLHFEFFTYQQNLRSFSQIF